MTAGAAAALSNGELWERWKDASDDWMEDTRNLEKARLVDALENEIVRRMQEAVRTRQVGATA